VIVDVGDSANPFVVGDTSLPVYAQAVWVNDNFGYGFVANDYEGLTVININDPTNPVVDSQYYGADDSRDVFVRGNYAYVANQRKGLKIIDVTDPSMPYELGEYDTVGTYPNLQTVWAVDTLVYIPVEWPFVFKILNVSNPSLPSLLSYCRMRTIGEDLFVKDSFAYAVGTAAFQAFRISNPLNPESLPTYLLPHDISYAVFVKDTFAYIANADSGLRILNISDPAVPFEVGYHNNPPGGGATGIYVKDTIAYFATWGGGLRILNVNDPSTPIEIGFHPAAAWDVVVQDTIAHVTSNLGRVNFINISNPTNPVLCGYYDAADYVGRLFVDSSLIYVTCYEAGLSILELTETGVIEQHRDNLINAQLSFNMLSNPIKNKGVLLISLPNEKEYQVGLFDIQGRKVICLDKGKRGGFIKKVFNLLDLPNGIYFAILKAEDKQLVRKVVVIH
jgi:hypothetical protein